MIVYDTGALVAAERSSRQLWALHAAALRKSLSPLVPAGMLAQAWRGGPQADLSRLLAGCTVMPLDEPFARAAGTLCGRAGTTDVVDAAVVILAQLAGATIVTGDPDDVHRLVEAAGGIPAKVHAI
ncbi:MAG: PIN domain-containing protein [Actinomycetota bacterium]|nr:PIN domain-containing protein [Actinomycetota bacterium]